MTKRIILALSILLIFIVNIEAQDKNFKCSIYNKEYDVSLVLNLYEEAITIPGQDVLGKVYGFLKKTTDSRTWIITGVTLSSDDRKATLEIVNDYGSEDLTATLTLLDDGSYLLTQNSGSVMKVAGKGKWIKIPKNLLFFKPQKK